MQSAMRNLILVLFIGSFHLPKTTPCVAVYGQCGGASYSGETICCDGSTCQISNPYYSQCLPNPAPPSTSCSAVWGQCGGNGWSGATTCCSGSTCQYSNPYYSQCLPSSSSSATASSSSTQSTSSSSISTSASTSSTASSSSTSASTSSSSTTANNQGCSAVWGQCGGIGWTGATTCCSGSTCQVSNPYYSQCLPSSSSSATASSSSTQSTSRSSISTSASTSSTASSSSTSASTSSSSTTASNQGCSAVWGQCGGIGWAGATTCCSGSTCQVSNPYYSQCLPSGQSSTTAGTAPSSSNSGSSTGSSTTSSVNSNSQTGTTTRYWDCCKPSCAWPGKASFTSPVETCATGGNTSVDANTPSGCDSGGSAYMCNNQQPWSVSSTLSYGYAAAKIKGQSESDWCCACYSLIFTSGPVIGMQLIVQVTNTGGDLADNQFDLAIPGGGFGLFNGCTSEYSGTFSWGQQYGGVSQRPECAGLPPVLQPGCYWRFDWFQGANNPTMSFTQVPCPSALTTNTQCSRN